MLIASKNLLKIRSVFNEDCFYKCLSVNTERYLGSFAWVLDQKFIFQNRRFHTAINLKIVYAGQSILKLNPDRETTMCLIQCIDCPSCIGLSLVPLKDDYFKGRKPKCFWFWPRKDLVRRFKKQWQLPYCGL